VWSGKAGWVCVERTPMVNIGVIYIYICVCVCVCVCVCLVDTSSGIEINVV
jgi:hypothetical protein